MSRKLIAGVFLCTLIVEAGAAPSNDWKDVSNALKGIYTRAGDNVLERLNSCKIKPDKTASWVEFLSADKPEYGAKKGETVVLLKMDFPATANYPGQKGLSALWILGHNKAMPVSSWAEMLQTRPVPFAPNYGMKC